MPLTEAGSDHIKQGYVMRRTKEGLHNFFGISRHPTDGPDGLEELLDRKEVQTHNTYDVELCD
jgi:hypothetical protein